MGGRERLTGADGLYESRGLPVPSRVFNNRKEVILCLIVYRRGRRHV
jgi:hypothetical protein